MDKNKLMEPVRGMYVFLLGVISLNGETNSINMLPPPKQRILTFQFLLAFHLPYPSFCKYNGLL